MKTKKLTPRHVAPVKRENVATVATDGNAIAFSTYCDLMTKECFPFAGDDAE